MTGSAREPAVIAWSGLAEHNPLPGITGSVHLGERLSAAVFRLAAGAVVPLHAHGNEEFGQVLSGSLTLETGGRRSAVAAGDGFLIPGEVPHAAVAGPHGCLLLECYAPARDPFPPADPGSTP
ncbi:cupin domain-containing protein [Actinomadura sp.]|uniref:cupin domain-containing protein n=1 Tax=Actinomadura sp. TaxID=1989 RepID=UPI0037C6F930